MSLRLIVDHRPEVMAKIMAAAGQGLADAADFLLEEANRTVPLEEGTLLRSGQATVDREALQAAVSYDTPYAVRQHEDTRLHHDKGRRAKWLEATFKERGDSALAHIAETMRAVT